jgi:hypothetical protein
VGLWLIPIRVPTAEVHVHADRRLAFQVLTSWGVPRPDSRGLSKVLEKSGDRVLCEFHTPVKAFGVLKWMQRTVEWVTAVEPERIEFQAVKAPLPILLCSWSLAEWGDCCLFTYDATIALHGSLLGWIFGVLFVRPMFGHMMQEHLAELRETIEARAARSRVFPQQPCPHAEPAGPILEESIPA